MACPRAGLPVFSSDMCLENASNEEIVRDGTKACRTRCITIAYPTTETREEKGTPLAESMQYRIHLRAQAEANGSE